MLVKAPLKQRSGCKPFIYSAIPGQDLICCQKTGYRERDENVREGIKNCEKLERENGDGCFIIVRTLFMLLQKLQKEVNNEI